MTGEATLPSEPHPHRPHVVSAPAILAGPPAPWVDGGADVPAVLIQVPLVPPRVRPARRPSAAATERIRAHGASGYRGHLIDRPRRRRLRREVRVAGYLLATALPLALAFALLRSAPAVGGISVAPSLRPPSVSLTLEIDQEAGPATRTPMPRPTAALASPIELRGYLLPYDERE